MKQTPSHLINVQPVNKPAKMDKFTIDEKTDDSASMSSTKPKTVKQLFADFFDYTTAHGLGRLASASRLPMRIFWLLCVAGAITMFVIQIADLFDKFLNIKPTSTTLNVKYDQTVPFPAVTICNLNMIKKSYLENLPEFQAMSTEFDDYFTDMSLNSSDGDQGWPEDDGTYDYGDGYNRRRRDVTLDDFIDINDEIEGRSPRRRRNAGNGTGTSDAEKYCPEYDEDGNCLYEEEPMDKAFEYEQQVQILLANKTFSSGNDSISKGGHQFNELVHDCSWKGYKCANASKFWTTFWDYKHGNCYTFNSGKDYKRKRKPILVSSKPGSSKGLRMLIGIDQDEYVGLLSQTAGVRIVVKDQDEMPFPAEEGISVPPGFSAKIGLRKKIIQRADPFKNRSCIPKEEQNSQNIYTKKYGAKYTVQSCMKSCLANYQLKKCGCAEADYPTGQRPCNPKDQETATCIGKSNAAFVNNKIGCADICKQPCGQTAFQASISFARWPSLEYGKSLMQKLYGTSTDDGFLKNNFLEIVIYYEELNVEEVKQEEFYGVTNLLSDIGGQIGLWIGLSVLTVCEIIELIFLIFRALVLKCAGGNKIKSSSYKS